MSTSTATDVADLCKVLAEPLRWRIVTLLAAEELCVCHLVTELGVAQPLVSHHLAALRRAGLVETEKWRYWTYYRLRADRLRVLANAVAGAAEAPTPGSARRPCC